MRRLTAIALLSVALGGGAAAWWSMREPPVRYVTAPAAKGDVVRAIIASGTVNPVVTVEVGTYVSGVIKSLTCDYNTTVKAGQLCAKIDPRPYQVQVDQAKANLSSAKAQLAKDQAALAYAKTNYERDQGLVKKGIVSQDTVDVDKSTYDQAVAEVALDQATIEQRQAALDAAQVNLAYTDIVSPVDGTVVSRNVSVGQTVAASFQTPTLFVIAQDLTKMQVDTNVSETDVGEAREGEVALFSVEAYPSETFEGKVTQVRQAPITVQNVVTYDVVINVDNPKNQLLPGMTANVRIVTAERNDVLKVPVAALQFQPTLARGSRGAMAEEAEKPESSPRVWVLRNREPAAVPVATGLDDGNAVEITGGDLKPGDAVIVNEVQRASSQAPPQRTSLRF